MEEVIKFKTRYGEGQIIYNDDVYVEVNASARYGVVVGLMKSPFTYYHPFYGYGTYDARFDVASGFMVCKLLGWEVLEYPEWLDEISEEVKM